MNFHEKLNEYIQMLSCTAKELSELSGLSAATLSRYRSGERVPDMRSSAFSLLFCHCQDLGTKGKFHAYSRCSTGELPLLRGSCHC